MRKLSLGRLWMVLIATWVVALGGCDTSLPPPPKAPPRIPLRIAAATDLKFALEDLSAAFEASYPTIDVTTNYGASGNLRALISRKAPLALFLAASGEDPQKVIADKLASPDGEFRYAIGKLVLWVSNKSTLDIEKQGLRALLDPSIKEVAIAVPAQEPYGRAAEAALKSAGIYDQVKDRFVIGENSAQAAQFVVTGAADAGLIPLSLAKSPTMADKGRYYIVPADTYPPLVQVGVVLNYADEQDIEAAAKFRQFLFSPIGEGILKKYGFDIPPQPPVAEK